MFQGLKSHAVTMFEVGKLLDESLDGFLSELEKVSNQTFYSICILVRNIYGVVKLELCFNNNLSYTSFLN